MRFLRQSFPFLLCASFACPLALAQDADALREATNEILTAFENDIRNLAETATTNSIAERIRNWADAGRWSTSDTSDSSLRLLSRAVRELNSGAPLKFYIQRSEDFVGELNGRLFQMGVDFFRFESDPAFIERYLLLGPHEGWFGTTLAKRIQGISVGSFSFFTAIVVGISYVSSRLQSSNLMEIVSDPSGVQRIIPFVAVGAVAGLWEWALSRFPENFSLKWPRWRRAASLLEGGLLFLGLGLAKASGQFISWMPYARVPFPSDILSPALLAAVTATVTIGIAESRFQNRFANDLMPAKNFYLWSTLSRMIRAAATMMILMNPKDVMGYAILGAYGLTVTLPTISLRNTQEAYDAYTRYIFVKFERDEDLNLKKVQNPSLQGLRNFCHKILGSLSRLPGL